MDVRVAGRSNTTRYIEVIKPKIKSNIFAYKRQEVTQEVELQVRNKKH